MDILGLQNQLMKSAKANPPSDKVPYAFEKRVMALLKDCKPLDPMQLWNRYFMRAAVCSSLVAVALTVVLQFLPEDKQKSQAASFSQEVEQTLYAAVDVPGPDQQEKE